MKKITVAVFVRKGDELLLGFKKRGFGAGRWDCFGGKVEAGETLVEAAKRELLEESGLVATTLQEVAQVTFDYETIPDQIENTVYICDDYTGEPIETEEMRPAWFKLAALPYADMWTDEQVWLPRILTGEKIEAAFHYKDLVEMREYTINEKPSNSL